jgi:hypothetical protein
MKKTVPLIITLALLYMMLLPNAQAVSPPPDGGYPNFTTAEGTNALKNLTTGAGNTAAGWFSLFTNSSGSYNTGLGAGTLLSTTRTQIRPLVLPRFYSTPSEPETQPLE